MAYEPTLSFHEIFTKVNNSKDKQKKIPTKKYVPQIIRKSYGTFVDKDNNKWDYIDG